MSDATRSGPCAIGAWGPRATEAALLADLFAALPTSISELGGSAGPVRVVVPSRSLRRHLLARVAAERLGVVGLEVLTLRRAASTILERAGRDVPHGDAVLDLLVRRAVAAQPVLARALGDLDDGIGVASASVRDLLEAGFEPELAPALDEALVGGGGGARDPEVERARSLVRSAAVAVTEARRLGVGGVADLYRSARELLLSRGAAALPSRSLLIHGFADATGVAADLLEALASRAAARVYLDWTPESESGARELSSRFGWRFRERIRGVTAIELRERSEPSSAFSTCSAVGLRAEVREVGFRVLEQLDEGVAPERIGLVARDLAPYAVALRDEWERLGIPYSGEQRFEGGSPTERRVLAMLELLERRDRVAIERWLALRGSGGIVPFDLRLALHQLGAARLDRAAALDPAHDLPAGDYPLPIREGLEPETESGEGAAPRRRLRRPRLIGALAEARALSARLAEWPERCPLDRHLRALARIRALFGEARDQAGEAEIDEALTTLRGELPARLELDRDELAHLVRETVRPWLGDPLGGQGGGVQVLDVTEARGRTFETLFLLGLHAGSFPRSVSEDPLLPDRVRVVLATVLPDLPRKLEGHDEERMLFGQMLSAAPSVVISRSSLDDRGRPLPPSPLLSRFRELLAGSGLETQRESPMRDAPIEKQPLLLPPADAVLEAALRLPRARLAPFLAAALGERDLAVTGVSSERRAAALLSALDELDPDLSTERGRARRATLGPFFGFVGSIRLTGDPRRRPLYVTRLEALCRCPWRLFLEGMLKLTPPTDSASELPPFDSSRLGRIVHAVLERLGRQAGAADRALVADLFAAEPALSSWPASADLAALARAEAARLLADEGLASWHLAVSEATHALAYLEVARALDGESVELLGVEVEGALGPRLGTVAEPIHFRADRIERRVGQTLLSDFKTGRPRGRASGEKGRRNELLRGIRSGQSLQAAAYAASLDGHAGGGRYLYLSPEVEPGQRELYVASDDTESRRGLEAALDAGRAALDRGALFPRLLHSDLEKSSELCQHCEVAIACLQHDSGARLRLAQRIARLRQGEARCESEAEAALVALHDLGFEPPEAGR